MINICVFCSSRKLKHEKYAEDIRSLGSKIGKRGYNLVYGGCRLGDMAVIAETTQEYGGKVTGVVPRAFLDYSKDDDDSIVTKDIAERKEHFEKLSDAFVILPGGFGTLEEFFDIFTKKLMDAHNKPIIIVNIEGYYDEFLSHLEKAYKEGFAEQSFKSIYSVVDNSEDALRVMEEQLKSLEKNFLEEHKKNLEIHKG